MMESETELTSELHTDSSSLSRRDRLERFLSASQDAPARWKAFDLSKYPSTFAAPLPASLIPLRNSRSARGLSSAEFQGLGVQFLKLNAEALTLLEQAILISSRSILRGSVPVRLDQGSAKLALEEYYHTRGFRAFLRFEQKLNWRMESLILFRSPMTRKAIAWIARHSPLSLCLPGAKLEAYSIAYSHHVRDAFGGTEVNGWARLQHLHGLDEAHHIPVQFELYRGLYPHGVKGLMTAVGTIAFVILLQVLLVRGSLEIARQALPTRGRFQKTWIGLRTAWWAVREFPPYRQALSMFRRQLDEPSLPYRSWFGFMAR